MKALFVSILCIALLTSNCLEETPKEETQANMEQQDPVPEADEEKLPWSEDNRNFMILSEQNWRKAMPRFTNLTIFFYSNKSKDYEQDLYQYKNINRNHRYLSVAYWAVEDDSEFCKKHKIDTFPYFAYFYNQQPVRFTEDFTTKQMSDFVERVYLSRVEEFIQSTDLDMTIANSTKHVAVYWGQNSGANYEVFKLASMQYAGDFVFATSDNIRLLRKYRRDKNLHVTIFKRYRKGVLDYINEMNIDLLNDYLGYSLIPLITPLNEPNLDLMQDPKDPVFLLSLSHSSPDFEKTRKLYEQIMSKVPKNWDYYLADMDNHETAMLAKNLFRVQDAQPTLSIYVKQKHGLPKIYNFVGKITENNILKFTKDFKDQKLELNIKSEPEPPKHDGNVIQITGKTFDKLVIQNVKKDVFVLAYQTLDENTQKLQTYMNSAIAKLHPKLKKNLVFGRIDASLNDIYNVEFGDFPTVIFYGTYKDIPVLFNGKITENIVYQWVKLQVSKVYEQLLEDDINQDL